MIKTLHAFEDFGPISVPIVLTIGNFDGIHLGHRAVLESVISKAQQMHAKSIVLSFENHPSEILRPSLKTPHLCTTEHKIKLLNEIQIDYLLLLKFTKELSEESAEVFLSRLRQNIPFDYLILGHDATLGKDREGNRARIRSLALSQHFNVEYLDELVVEGVRVSSSLIRQLVQEGNFDGVKKLLGRPYSIYAKVVEGTGLGTKIGFPTANIPVNNLCLPPLGVYAVQVECLGQMHDGIANLGVAPTVRQDIEPILEVHLFNHQESLSGKMVDVFFCQYIRPEKKFNGIEDLKTQIAKDILIAKENSATRGVR